MTDDLQEDVLYHLTPRVVTSAGEEEGRTVSTKTENDSEYLTLTGASNN